MMLRRIHSLLLLSFCLMILTSTALAQPGNMLKNPNADEGASDWQAEGKATIDESTGSFLVRDGGFFYQEIALPEGSAGQYVVLMGSAASERINADGAITGLPLLYGYMMKPVPAGGGRIYAYLQGQQMLSSSRVENEWVKLWGIFRVPPGAERIRLFLKQALRQDAPFNGSAARFRELGVYFFVTELAARAFVGSMLPAAAANESEPKAEPSPAPKSSCALTLEQAPSMDGLKFGMSMEEVSAALPVTEEELKRSRATMHTVYAQAVGLRSLSVIPSASSFQSAFGDARQYSLRFLDGKLYHIHFSFKNSDASDVDELIRKWAGLWNLPGPDAWQPIQGQGSTDRGKFLVCNGFEITAYGSEDEKAGFIWMVNSQAERIAQERASKINGAARR